MDTVTRRRAATLIANSEYTLSTLGRRRVSRTRVVENLVGNTIVDVAAESRATISSPYIVTVVNGFSPLKNVEGALRGCEVLRREGIRRGIGLRGARLRTWRSG